MLVNRAVNDDRVDLAVSQFGLEAVVEKYRSYGSKIGSNKREG